VPATPEAHLEATRAAYDAVAELYAAMFGDSLATRPLDRGMLTAFAELARAGAPHPVADVGCGPGQLTAFLHALGVDIFGVDVSPAMVGLARRAHPDLRFDVTAMTGLDRPDGALAGIVAWYSIIHIPPADLPGTLAEFHRLLAPGSWLLLALQSTDRPDGPALPFDHKVTTAYRWPTETLTAVLRDAGFSATAQLVRAPTDTERFLQAFLLFQKPGPDQRQPRPEKG
jgi:SAM-dependent methyltransferase